MRIIHFSCVAPPEAGGIGRVAALEVASLVERGHDAHIVSLTTHAGFRIGNAGSVHAVDHLIRDVDIVHLHYPFFGTAGALARLRRKGAIGRLVMTLHMDATSNGLKGRLFNLYRRFFQPAILASADALVVSSCDYAQHSSFAPFADRAIELPFGVDEARFSPGPDLLRHSTFDIRHSTILFVGAMDRAHAFKGVDVLIRAMTKIPDARLMLVGDGALRSSYERLAREMDIADRCNFTGSLHDDRLVDAYRSADVLAFPSTSAAEAFGLVALEAQSCGVPVVASDLPGVRTVVADGETGFLIPAGRPDALAERLNRILKNDELRHRMGASARRRVLDKFTWSRHMNELMKMYKSSG